jgi:hypothetical protein
MISDVDLEWILLQERLREPDRAQRRVASRPWRMPRRLAPAPVGAGTAAVAAVLVIGAGAAAALTTIYAPAGVGSPSSIAIQPQVTATVHFSQSAGPAIGGSTLEITGGPAIVVQYGSRSARANLTTLAIAAM